jgi:glycosyltransferase involved in cell wall biosynthesis
VAPEKIRTISTGINLAGFVEAAKLSPAEARRRLGIPLSRQMVLTTGRFHPVKGFEYLIRAAEYFPPDEVPLFYLLGDGPLWESLREKAGSLSHVILPGKKSHQEVLLHYRAADVFVMCSVDLPWQSEAIPTVLIEALALGLPVVATDTGEGPDLIQDGVNGLVVPQRDPKKLQEAIKSLLSLIGSPEKREWIARHNRGLAAERDWPRVAEKIEGVYLELLGRQG